MTNDILDMFVKETNLYAKQTIEAARQRSGGLTKCGRFAAWYDTDREEMKQFIALMLLMGIVRKPTVESYWSNNPLLSTPIFRSVMPRNRF